MRRTLFTTVVAALALFMLPTPAFSYDPEAENVFAYGDAQYHGSTGDLELNSHVIDIESTKSGNGYWELAQDGGIFSYGDAQFHGSTGSMTLNKPIVGMASTLSGGGYNLVAKDGGIFSFGDAPFHGSAGGTDLQGKTVVGISMTPTGSGYWLVLSGTTASTAPAPVPTGEPAKLWHYS